MIQYVGISKSALLKKHLRLYRFISLERLLGILETGSLTFIDPEKWSDPFEKYFLNAKYSVKNKSVTLPMRSNVYCVCFSGTSSSEAYWKVYAPKENGIRLTIDTYKLIKVLDLIIDANVFIGKVNYQVTREFHKVSLNRSALVNEIKKDEIGENQIKLLLKKRKAFLYEDEIRIILVPHQKNLKSSFYEPKMNFLDLIESYLLDPRIQPLQTKMLKEYFIKTYSIHLAKSTLYKEIKVKAVKL